MYWPAVSRGALAFALLLSQASTADADATDDTATLTHDAPSGGGDSPNIDDTGVKATQATTAAAPGPPPLISPRLAGDGRVTLKWWSPRNEDIPITHWQFRQKADGGTWSGWTNISGSNADTRRHRITGLKNGTQYTSQVRAVNDAGPGAPSSEVTMTPMARSFTLTPDNSSVTEGDSGIASVAFTVTLSEDAPSGGVVVWMTGESQTRAGIATMFEATSCPHASQPEDTDVCYPSGDQIVIPEGSRTGTLTLGVQGDNRDEPEESAVVLVSTRSWGGDAILLAIVDDDDAPPDAPTGLEAEAGDGRVTLRWNDPKDASITGYELQRKGKEKWSEWDNIDGSDASTTQFTATGLNNGAEYRFRIRARNGAGAGDRSDAVTATPAPGLSQVALTFSRNDVAVAPDETATYTVRLTRAFAGTVRIASAATDTATVTPATLDFTTADYASPQTVTVTGKAVGGTTIGHALRRAGASVDTISNAGTVTVTVSAAGPPAPTGFTTAAGNRQVRLHWKNPGNASISGWQFQQREGGGNYGAWMDIRGSGATTTSHTVTSLSNGTLFFFRIRAVNADGAGAASGEVWSIPAAPGPVTLTATPGDREVTLSWVLDSQEADVTSLWRYQMKSDGGNFAGFQHLYVAGRAGNTRVTGLINDTPYTFHMLNNGPEEGVTNPTR